MIWVSWGCEVGVEVMNGVGAEVVGRRQLAEMRKEKKGLCCEERKKGKKKREWAGLEGKKERRKKGGGSEEVSALLWACGCWTCG